MSRSPNARLQVKVKWLAAAVVLLCIAACGRSKLVSNAPCDNSLTREIPARPNGAPDGKQFGRQIEGLSDDERELLIRGELLTGNIPDFLRRFVPVRFSAAQPDGHVAQIVVCAAPDYLAIGSDRDFLLMPMRLETALAMAVRFDLTLPTPKMVDGIYAQAAVHLAPRPLPAGDAMRSTEYYRHHSDLIRAQRLALGAVPGGLTAGDKKDLVLTNRLWGNLDRVAIYGWHLSDNSPIQPLSTVHDWRYADYSHGVRLINTRVWVDGVPRLIFDVLQDRQLSAALRHEGDIPDMVQLIRVLSADPHTAVATLTPDSQN